MRLSDYLRHPARVRRKAQWWLIRAGPQRDVTVDSYNGRLTFDSRDRLTGKYLMVRGGYEQAFIERSLGLLEREGWIRRGGTVVDVGAHIGMISIALVRHRWFDRAVAIEPAPDNLRLLERNVAQNGLRASITIAPLAISSAAGSAELELAPDNFGDHRLRHSRAAGAFGEEHRRTVPTVVRTLDGALDELGVDRSEVRLVWVDIQGGEGHLLEGAAETFANGAPLVTEFWPYGIVRSGATRESFGAAARRLFSYCYVIHGDRIEGMAVSELGSLFDRYRGPKDLCNLLLVGERKG